MTCSSVPAELTKILETNRDIMQHPECTIRRHNTEYDCWIIKGNIVYDVSAYIRVHPGGAKSIMGYAGGIKDCGGSYGFHSKKAKKMWEDFRIGFVKKCPNGCQSLSGDVIQDSALCETCPMAEGCTTANNLFFNAIVKSNSADFKDHFKDDVLTISIPPTPGTSAESEEEGINSATAETCRGGVGCSAKPRSKCGRYKLCQMALKDASEK